MAAHFEQTHPREPKSQYEALWKLDSEEVGWLRTIYKQRQDVPKERQGRVKAKSKKSLPFSISEATGTQLALRYVYLNLSTFRTDSDECFVGFNHRTTDLAPPQPQATSTAAVDEAQVDQEIPSQLLADADARSDGAKSAEKSDLEDESDHEVSALERHGDSSDSEAGSWDSDANVSRDDYDYDEDEHDEEPREGMPHLSI